MGGGGGVCVQKNPAVNLDANARVAATSSDRSIPKES